MRRTKATLIYQRTKNLRTVQLLLGHSKLESTIRYLGTEVDDALVEAMRPISVEIVTAYLNGETPWVVFGLADSLFAPRLAIA